MQIQRFRKKKAIFGKVVKGEGPKKGSLYVKWTGSDAGKNDSFEMNIVICSPSEVLETPSPQQSFAIKVTFQVTENY